MSNGPSAQGLTAQESLSPRAEYAASQHAIIDSHGRTTLAASASEDRYEVWAEGWRCGLRVKWLGGITSS